MKRLKFRRNTNAQWRTEGTTRPGWHYQRGGKKVKFMVNDVQKVKFREKTKKGRRKFWQWWKMGGAHGKRAKKVKFG